MKFEPVKTSRYLDSTQSDASRLGTSSRTDTSARHMSMQLQLLPDNLTQSVGLEHETALWLTVSNLG